MDEFRAEIQVVKYGNGFTLTEPCRVRIHRCRGPICLECDRLVVRHVPQVEAERREQQR
jgi:hypothetical protein